MKKIHLPSKPKSSKGGGYESDKEAAASDSEVLRSPRVVKMKKLHFKREDAGAASDGKATKSPRQLKAKKFCKAGSLSVKKMPDFMANFQKKKTAREEAAPAVSDFLRVRLTCDVRYFCSRLAARVEAYSLLGLELEISLELASLSLKLETWSQGSLKS